MTYLLATIYYQLLAYSRAKQAVFYTIAFPIMLFVIFSSLWGSSGEAYTGFLLTGVVGMTIASQGLFGFGPIIKMYYSTNLIKFIRNMPKSSMVHFLGLLISRIVIIFTSILLLFIVASVFFNYHVTIREAVRILLGSVLGILLFSSVGLVIAFWTKQDDGNRGIINLIYFTMIFTSETFYPVSTVNVFVDYWTVILPLTPLLELLRGNAEMYNLLSLSGWIVVSTILFYFLFNRSSVNR